MPLYHLSWLRAKNVYWLTTVSSWQRKEAEDTPHKKIVWHSVSGKYNRPSQSLLHSLERAAAGIGPHVNAYKTEYICFNQRGDVSTQNDSSLKQVDKFTYIGSSVSSTEKDINTRLANYIYILSVYIYTHMHIHTEIYWSAWCLRQFYSSK